MQILVTRTGVVHCVYDEMIDLSALGRVEILRGSHVEPYPDGAWRADLSPVNGPVLGPFRLRSDALAAERMWLETNWLGHASAASIVQVPTNIMH